MSCGKATTNTIVRIIATTFKFKSQNTDVGMIEREIKHKVTGRKISKDIVWCVFFLKKSCSNVFVHISFAMFVIFSASCFHITKFMKMMRFSSCLLVCMEMWSRRKDVRWSILKAESVFISKLFQSNRAMDEQAARDTIQMRMSLFIIVSMKFEILYSVDSLFVHSQLRFLCVYFEHACLH